MAGDVSETMKCVIMWYFLGIIKNFIPLNVDSTLE